MSDNIKLAVKGKKLIVEIDISKKGVLSKSGKSMVIASTRGNMTIPGQPELRLGLNLYNRNND